MKKQVKRIARAAFALFILFFLAGATSAQLTAMKGIQLVLDEIGSRNPKAREIAPDSLVDLSYLKEIDNSGFIKALYEK